MGIKSIGASLFSNWVVRQNHKWSSRPFDTQKKVFEQLISKVRLTRFGRDHKLDQVSDHNTFKEAVQVRDYEGIKDYSPNIFHRLDNLLKKLIKSQVNKNKIAKKNDIFFKFILK